MTNNEARKILCRLLKELRMRNHYTQYTVEASLNMPKGSLSKIENGSRNPECYELYRLCNLYKVNMHDLFDVCNKVLQAEASQPGMVHENISYGIKKRSPASSSRNSRSMETCPDADWRKVEYTDPDQRFRVSFHYRNPPTDTGLIYRMVQERVIEPNQAACGLGITTIQLEEDMNRAGYYIPKKG